MATFNPVNTTIVQDSHSRIGEESNPLTPRPNTAPSSQLPMSRDDAKTPTRANFGGLASQQPLPSPSAFPPPVPTTTEAGSSLVRANSTSQYGSSQSPNSSGDVEMEDGVEENQEGQEGQDGEEETEVITNPDGTKSVVKKKGGGKTQRFYCTDYAPCNLSFTRSEHLARHIRKHTGERPFQCHCGRKFSRLDNLRQHAQTVHQNEDIPQDSLAATGTRFQRQVRTERVRPPGSRSRANTASGVTPHMRGHTRNSLSASSISSISSSYSQREDVRRRPPPLVMAGEPRSRYSQEIYRAESPLGQYAYRPQSPGGFSTPTSATYSNGPNSPRWTPGMQSPGSTHSRTNSIYSGHRTPGRRLSVPSVGNPFQSPHGGSYPPPALGQINPPTSGTFSPTNSMISSPTSSTAGSIYSRRESINAGDDFRRRTWHPETYTNLNSVYTSRLQQVTTPNYYAVGTPPQAPVVPSNAPPLRLPGIESFDPLRRPTTPVRRQPSPMLIDTPTRPPPQQPAEPYQNERPNSQHWDQGIHGNMNRLHLTQTPPTESARNWAPDPRTVQVQAQAQVQAEQPRPQPAVRFEDPYAARQNQAQADRGQWLAQQHHASAPPITPKGNKRHAWYHGPVAAQPQPYPPPVLSSQPAQRTSPADSSSSEGIPGTPSGSGVNDYNPGIVHASGWVENRPQDPLAGQPRGYPQGSYTYAPPQAQQQHVDRMDVPKSSERDNSALDVLVAVATREENVAAAY